MMDSGRPAELRPKRIRPRQWDIFFSYAREDAEIANELVVCLEGHGFSVWSDAKLGPSDRLSIIDMALETSGVAIILFSTPYFSSRWLRREVGHAFEEFSSNRFYPIALGEIDVRIAPRYLAERKWLHLSDRRSIPKLVEKIRRSIEISLGSKSSTAYRTRVIGEMPPRQPAAGADEYLKALRSQPIGISGIVGVAGSGKTVLAAEYAYAAMGDVDFIYWTHASTISPTIFGAQLQQLVEHGSGIVVVDGWDSGTVQSTPIVDRIIAFGDRARIVLTTRDLQSLKPFRASKCTLHVLDELPRGAVADYLAFFSPQVRTYSTHEIDEISRLTGGVPLAVRWMAHVLQNRSIDEIDSVRGGPEVAIKAIFSAALEDLSQHQRRRLDVLSFCPRLLTTIQAEGNWRRPGDRELLSYLIDYGFVMRGSGGRLTMHPGVITFLRAGAQRAALKDAIRYVVSCLPDPTGPNSRDLLPSVVELAEMAEWDVAKANPVDLAELLIWQGAAWRVLGETDRAEAPCMRALDIAQESGDALLRIRALNLQSSIAFDSGRVSEASAIEHRSAELALSELGPAHPVSLATLSNLATTLQGLGNLPAAIVLLRRIVDSMPINHPDRIAVQSNLAVCLREGGFVDEAIDLLDNARELARTQFSPKIKRQLDQNMAALMLESDRAQDALAILLATLRAVDLAGEEYSERLEIQSKLALTYAALGRNEDALDTQYEVVDNCELFFGGDHPSTLQALHFLAALLIDAERSTEAIAVASEASSRRERILGPDHVETLRTRFLEVDALRSSGDSPAALDRCLSLSVDLNRVLGEKHPMAIASREEAADLYGSIGVEQEAKAMYRALILELKGDLTNSHPTVVRLKRKLGGKNDSTPPSDRFRIIRGNFGG
ncbi:tetratricopeptide repeat protein [Nocardia gipuzkoensis]